MGKVLFAILLISGKLTTGQIVNNDFELWDTTYTNVYSAELTSLFGVPNPYGGTIHKWTSGSGFGISQTTDSYSGNHALILHNWYGYAKEWITYRDSLNFRPAYLQGYFKYMSGGINGLSQGTAIITLTRFNGTSNDTIATGTYQFDSTTSYIPFQVTLNYQSLLNPDSITLYFLNANSNCIHNIVCNLLYLDNLTLTNTPLGIKNLDATEENLVNIFPNPINDILIIENNANQRLQLTLYNSIGQMVLIKSFKEKTNRIDLSAYSDNIYYYRVNNDQHLVKSGKIIKQ